MNLKNKYAHLFKSIKVIVQIVDQFYLCCHTVSEF